MGWIAAGIGVVALVGVSAAGYAAASRVETPDYVVEVADGPIEIRRYPAMTAAQVARPGDRQEAVRAAFSPLARYIVGRDRPGEKIAMTAPVTQTPEAGDWTVRFLMPAGRRLGDLPAPSGDVRLVEVPEARVAAIRFSGRWTDANFDRAEASLAAWLDARGLTPAGPPTYAYYNDPFTPAFLRRNEVLAPLAN